jgi:L-fucose mutarotase
MLKSQLLHPDILSALARAGHTAKILIADGNFPFSTQLGPNATLVNLNLSPGVVSVTQVLEALLSVVPVEAAAVMEPVKSGPYAMPTDPPVWTDFRRILQSSGADLQLERLERLKFLETVRGPNIALTVATAEQRLWANLILQIGLALPG